jgi:hypothetical protein
MEHMFPQGTWAFPWGKLIFPQGTIMSLGRKSLNVPKEQLKPLFPREQSCPPGRSLSCHGGIMCLEFYLIITFAYDFWLKCFQLQSCNCHVDLSNDRSQDYVKTKMRWPWLQKI